jgi:rhodanese-related sulfurtransferase
MLIAGLFLLNVNSFAGTNSAPIASVSPQEAAVMVTQKHAIIIDVRDNEEWHAQHIAGAVHIPLAQLQDRLAELKNDKDHLIITQCRSGKRSAKALELLKSAGFSNVSNMEGGIQAWTQQGLATE